VAGNSEGLGVVVVDPHDIYRRGLVVCLRDDPELIVVYEGPAVPAARMGDIALCRADLLPQIPLDMPAVLIAGGPGFLKAPAGSNVFAVLDRESLDTRHLVAAVRAAAVGLRISTFPATHDLVSRDVEVLRLLADGAETREIAEALGYSERTIKEAITQTKRLLGARTRAHAVAEAMRLHLI
jgi:DNA-binding CsgD family transcriptional regulator